MAFMKVFLAVSLAVVLSGFVCEALECCSEYTDIYGTHHKPQLCQDYCCLDISLETITQGTLKSCCSDEKLRVPPDQRTEDCVVSWISQHIWVPIVGGLGLIVIIVAIILCCCCCRR